MIRAMGRQQTGSVHHFGVAAPGDVDDIGAHALASLGHLDGLLDGDAARLEVAKFLTKPTGVRHFTVYLTQFTHPSLASNFPKW